jgi:hypothetical protein
MQIMQITAILPGQSPPKRFTIPSRKSSVAQSVQAENVPTRDGLTGQAQVPGNGRADAVTTSLKDLDVNSSERATEHVPVRRMDSQTSEVDEFHDAEP